MTENDEKTAVIILTCICGLEKTFEHYKNKFPIGTQGHLIWSRIPDVKHLVEKYLLELNK